MTVLQDELQHEHTILYRNVAPWTTVDPTRGREWLHPEPLRNYLHQRQDGEWTVADRYLDIGVAWAKSRKGAIRKFYRKMGRPVPKGKELPVLQVAKSEEEQPRSRQKVLTSRSPVRRQKRNT